METQHPEKSVLTDLLRILALLISQRRLILVVTLVATLVAAAGSWLLLDNWYLATVSAVPPRRSGSVLDGLTGNISSTLKDFGLTKLAGGKTDGYTHVVVLQSRRMQDTIIKIFQLAKFYDFPDTAAIELRKKLSEDLFIGMEDEGNYIVNALHKDPRVAAAMANKVIEVGNVFATEIFQAEARVGLGILEQRIAQEDSKLTTARDSLVHFSRRYKLFSPLDQARGAATALADVRVQRYKQELAAEMAETIYGSQDPYAQAQQKLLREVQSQQNRIETEPGVAGDFSLKGIGADVVLEYTRLFADVEVSTRLRAILLPMIEQARQDIHRVTPSLYVLDPAVPPNKKDRPKRSLIVVAAAVGAFLLTALFVILRDRFFALRHHYRAVVQEMRDAETKAETKTETKTAAKTEAKTETTTEPRA
jgi:tyrosine-protein kinase Etk/Wzc